MKTVIFFFLTVIAVAAVSSFCTLRWAAARPPATLDAHAWLHRELDLTEAQHAALEPVESRFAAKQLDLSAGLRAANHELAQAMGEDRAYTPRVAAAVETIHHRMGDLQKASIEHVFEMRAVLNPDQGDKLLHLAQEALEASP
ncbi:MAG TPA: periplasmic heavy metal sensor [Candidatus Didemnitutus sp.]|nr:periplasmic heavy metal sensor [Candidatus Didemnitutus sp.]